MVLKNKLLKCDWLAVSMPYTFCFVLSGHAIWVFVYSFSFAYFSMVDEHVLRMMITYTH